MPQPETKYLVAVNRNHNGPETHCEWLVCITYDPYRRGGLAPILSSSDVTEAFVFRTLAAAEMAAVWCSGVVADAKGWVP
jgi:hypothetical protein